MLRRIPSLLARCCLPLLLAGGALLSLPAVAGPSMDQAVKAAEQRYHARVVKAESQNEGGHTVYVLRLLNESGKVWTVRVDANSGAMQ